ncbi:MAG: hypothetical protein JXA93_08745, partial [Anaerolineae bacterium]|nr:hypothetical protein [Anaerolineae bacterium]
PFSWNGVVAPRPMPESEVNVNDNWSCHHCPALGSSCDGDESGGAGCGSLVGWIEALDGLDLDVSLAPQPAFDLPSPFFPQLLNGIELPSMIAREPVMAVGIAKALTPRGKVSRRAVPERYGTQSLRAQWGIDEETMVLCMGNYLDGYLERLWAAQHGQNAWGRVQGLGFDAATSLNFSVYLDRPRLEHLVNVKRSWLTVKRIQETSTLIPIPHLQWATLLDLERQLCYAREQGFHTLTLNLQMWKRQGWELVVDGLRLIRETEPELRLLVAGVSGLKRLAELAELLPDACFTNTTAHYLAQRYLRLRRHGTRLIKEPVEGHPDIVLAENVRLYRDFLDELRGHTARSRTSPTTADPLQTSLAETTALLAERFAFSARAAHDLFRHLAVDETILDAFLLWLRTGELDRQFGGSFPAWPYSEAVARQTMGELLDLGLKPMDAFLRLASLAQQVDEEIEVRVGQAGY